MWGALGAEKGKRQCKKGLKVEAYPAGSCNSGRG